MILYELITSKIIELLKDNREVEYSHNEIVKMTANSTVNEFISEQLPMDTEVEEIKNRFIELDEENHIEAVMLVFNVKPPRKRKSIKKEIYCKINTEG